MLYLRYKLTLCWRHLWTPINVVITFKITLLYNITGADPGFQVRGAGVLKKIAPSRGRHEIFGVFRVKNHDFTPKNHIFFNCRGRRENFWGISCEKSRFYAKKKSHLLFFHVNYLWFMYYVVCCIACYMLFLFLPLFSQFMWKQWMGNT
jgi:hypothetical protein